MSQAENIVKKFLRQESMSKSVDCYVLRHAGKGSKGVDVEVFEMSEALTVDELDNLAVMIVGRAQLDADGWGPALQRYTLTSMVKDHASARVVFRLKGAVDLDIDDEESGEESPNQRGLLQQLMRHNEANNRTMVASVGAILTSMGRRMESQDKLIENLMHQRIESFQIVEDSLSRKHEREMERFVLEEKEKRVTIGLSKVTMLIPVIMDKLSGGKLPSKTDPTMMMLGELIGSMSVEQLQAVQRSLSPEQQIVFYSLLKKFQEQKALPADSGANGVQKEN